MNTPNPEIQMPQASRRRGRYSDEFKSQVVSACLAPGVSTTAIALANGLNANMLRRWVVESSQGRNSQLATIAKPPLTALANSDFIPVKFALAPSAQVANIRIELQHANTLTPRFKSTGQCPHQINAPNGCARCWHDPH